jgi:hypothetical protein
VFAHVLRTFGFRSDLKNFKNEDMTMRNLKKAGVLAVVSLMAAFSSAASAGCIRADATGTWRIYTPYISSVNSVMRCTIIIPAAGTAVATTSSCFIPGLADAVPVSGNLTLGSNCRVFGKLMIGNMPRQIDGWVSKGKDSLSGMGWNPSNPNDGTASNFSGAKQ